MSETPQPALDLKGDTPKQWDPENEAQWEGGGKQLANRGSAFHPGVGGVCRSRGAYGDSSSSFILWM